MLFLLSGLPCSGKTTYAVGLESTGVVRVSVDQMMIESFGRLGIDYEPSDHTSLLEPVVAAARDRIAELLAAGRDVVFDHGLGRRAERDELKRIAETHSAKWTLLCFDADLSTLRVRCRERSHTSGTVPISDEILDLLAATWERPSGEEETVVASG